MLVLLTTFTFNRDDLIRLAVPICLVEIARVALDLCLLISQRSDSFECVLHVFHIFWCILVLELNRITVLLGDIRPLALLTGRQYAVIILQIVVFCD